MRPQTVPRASSPKRAERPSRRRSPDGYIPSHRVTSAKRSDVAIERDIEGTGELDAMLNAGTIERAEGSGPANKGDVSRWPLRCSMSLKSRRFMATELGSCELAPA